MGKYKLNNIVIRQPESGMGYNFESKYTSDSARVQSGVGVFTPMFTVESLSYSATGLTVDEVKTILQIVAKGGTYTLHYFSPYYGTWRDDKFYTGQGSINIGYIDMEAGLYDSLSFNMIGVNPI